MRQRDAGFAIERLGVRGRLFLIGAALLLCLPDFGAIPVVIAAVLLVASNLLPVYLCRSYERYTRLGIYSAALRGADVLMLTLTGLLPLAHNTKLWMLCVPIVMVQALARRSLIELVTLTVLACAGKPALWRFLMLRSPNGCERCCSLSLVRWRVESSRHINNEYQLKPTVADFGASWRLPVPCPPAKTSTR